MNRSQLNIGERKTDDTGKVWERTFLCWAMVCPVDDVLMVLDDGHGFVMCETCGRRAVDLYGPVAPAPNQEVVS